MGVLLRCRGGLSFGSRVQCIPAGWLGSPLVTSSSLGQSCPPAHHGQVELRSERSAVLPFPGEQQRWCCDRPLAPTSPHSVCAIHLFVWELVWELQFSLSGFGSVLQALLTLRPNQVSKQIGIVFKVHCLFEAAKSDFSCLLNALALRCGFP